MNNYAPNFNNEMLLLKDTRITRRFNNAKLEFLLNTTDESLHSQLKLNAVFVAISKLVYRDTSALDASECLLVLEAFSKMHSLNPNDESLLAIRDLYNDYTKLHLTEAA